MDEPIDLGKGQCGMGSRQHSAGSNSGQPRSPRLTRLLSHTAWPKTPPARDALLQILYKEIEKTYLIFKKTIQLLLKKEEQLRNIITFMPFTILI